LIPTGHPAAEILAEFGGLTVGLGSPGTKGAATDIVFEHTLPDAPEDIVTWSKLLGSPLIGVAEYSRRHMALYADDLGRLFGLSIVHDALFFNGQTFGEAMERLVLGRHSQPLLRPDQSSVRAYGEEITADHPSVYRYR
jgi:hypothetical protein